MFTAACQKAKNSDMEIIRAIEQQASLKLGNRASWASSRLADDDCFDEGLTIDLESSTPSRGYLVYFQVRQ